MLLYNQIPGFFDFRHSAIHQGKVASETTTFSCVSPGMLNHAQTCLDLPLSLVLSLLVLGTFAGKK